MRHSTIRITVVLIVLFVVMFFLFYPMNPSNTGLFGNIPLGLDIKGGSLLEYTFSGNITPDTANQVVTILRRRLDDANYTEANVSTLGNNGIRVEIPGIDNPQQAENLIGQRGELYFAQVLDTVQSPVKPAPKIGLQYAGAEWLLSKDPSVPPNTWYLVNRNIQVGAGTLQLNGSEVSNANAAINTSTGGWEIDLSFNAKGAQDFYQITQALVGKPLAIVLDNYVLSAPIVQQPIQGGRAQITGNFTFKQAQDLAALIRSGNLPVTLNLSEERTIGPTLGSDVIHTSIIVGLIGIAIVLAYMLIYYGPLIGLVADLALIYNSLFILGMLALTHSILTLPGIAGVILTIGITVDGNVIIFERIKEEMRTGKTPKAAITAGFTRSTAVILDANISTLIVAFVLYYFGTGSIKGFAVTLTIGILGTIFTSLVFSRVFMDYFSPFIKNKYLPASNAGQVQSVNPVQKNVNPEQKKGGNKK
ncbi:MAG: protein translocase subunit SecD [Mesoaciditoga sp.]|uniref:protein translocase subunit SecD n=1 Tax=Athalassotoga sp. TaxID=2022597 RepID=UPI000CA886F3|nr:MAG: protein translocase subunit SecD [Mesoaciditoga sp.]PMP80829.1 MAG: protein translocase subunit SecD [Mesoaciditoga sp.]HEU24179.1 protein translocase subunit SecD [Mesoaciditoga lauensis]